MPREVTPTFILVSMIDAGANTVDKLSRELALSPKHVRRVCNSLKVMGRINKNGDDISIPDGIPRLKFTWGHSHSYDTGIIQLGAEFQKRGATGLVDDKPYLGGAIWHRLQDAADYLAARRAYNPAYWGYSIYGVVTYAASDLKQLEAEPFFRLQVNRRIVALPYDGTT